MAILNISGVPYNYPDPGTEAGWGEDATGWAEAVTLLLNALVANGDILLTTFAVQNNTAAPTNVTGLVFSTGVVRSARIDYTIIRSSTSTPAGIAESGMILLVYNGLASPGSKWQLTQYGNGNAGVAFSITDAGQMQYLSTDIGSAGYAGTLKFTAKVLNQ